MFVFGSLVFGDSLMFVRDCLERYHWFSMVLLFICICMLFDGSGSVVFLVWYIDRDFCMFFRVVILTESLACLEYEE